jgi:integrase
LGLEWRQVDIDGKVMYRTRKGERSHEKKQAPPVRLGRRILGHLKRWKRLDGPAVYVCHYNGARVTKMRRSWAAARERAGLDDEVTPHTLRHTRATWLMQAGVPIWQAAGALGMSTEILQTVYGKHDPDWQRDAAEV